MKSTAREKKKALRMHGECKNIISLGTAGFIMLLTVLPELKRMEN
ncbi:MAG: hypothetical protein ACLU6Y_03000 [Ruminococcus sp.]